MIASSVTACGSTLTALNGTIQTPGYPANYKKSHRCQWLIQVPANHVVSLEFLDFRLEDTPSCRDCTCDRVEVSELLANGNASALLGVFCMGARAPSRPVVSHSNNMVVRFIPDAFINAEGFRARYSAVPTEGKD